MNCEVCGHPLMRAGTKEYVVLIDETKAEKRTEEQWICVNSQCVNYAGDPTNIAKEVSLTYEKNGKTITEYDKRPNIDFSNPRVVAQRNAFSSEIPVINAKEFAEKTVLGYTGDEAMVLASKLAERADTNAV